MYITGNSWLYLLNARKQKEKKNNNTNIVVVIVLGLRADFLFIYFVDVAPLNKDLLQ